MPKTRPPYPPKYRKQIVELVRAGRSPDDLAREFDPSGVRIRSWIKQVYLDEGRREDGLTMAEREDLVRLRRENKRLRLEREILTHCPDVLWEKPPPGSLGRLTRHHPNLRVRESKSGELPCSHDVPTAGSRHQRVLCVAACPGQGNINLPSALGKTQS